MMLRSIYRLLLLLLLITLFTGLINKSKAGVESHEQFSNAGVDIRTITSLTIEDDKVDPAVYPNFNWSIVHTNAIKNTVSLRLVNQQLCTYAMRFEVKFTLQYFTDPGLTISNTITDTLHVDYNPNSGISYRAIDTHNYTGAYKSIITAITVTDMDNPGNTTFPSILQIGGSVTIDRTYDILPNINLNLQVTKLHTTTSSTSPTKQLNLSWDFTPGQEEYDIEWATLDDDTDYATLINNMLTAGSNISLNVDDIDQLFHNNATRVTVTNAHDYTLSLMYNDRYILVRIRYAHYNADGIRVTSDWTYTYRPDPSGSPTVYNYNIWNLDWNEANLNWQYSAAFAEEGKKKEVISYFDGTLRGRQTVTLANNLGDDVAIAQENVYDEFGRPTASILPAPFYEASGISSYLHFKQQFNTNTSSGTASAYNVKNIFSSATAQQCENMPDGLDQTTGAARYYSSNNELLSITPASNSNKYKKYNFFIPNANSYPLSVEQYTNDNTGRIKLQGGVGADLQPQSGGSKTTKYFYGKPEQWELDQMFGNDVGYAEHYLKNMVIDPNGQTSISYINASGKTIATALASANPSSLDPLSDINDNVQTGRVTQLLKPDQFRFSSSDMTIRATTTYLSADPNTSVKFSYNIKQLLDTYPATSPNVNSNCYYTLAINIVDECGTPVNQFPYKITTPFVPDNVTHDINTTFTVPGTYYITFELFLDKNIINSTADNYINQAQSLNILQNRYDYIKQNFLQSLDVSGNYNDCRTCRLLLGTQTDFVAMVTKKFTEAGITLTGTDFSTWVTALYTSLQLKCTALEANCNFSPCDGYKNQMEADVSPGGQYALFYSDDTATPIEPEINVLSLHFNDVFRPGSPPATIPADDYVTFSDGSIVSVYDTRFDLKALLKYWKPVWAEKFLAYHPEICKLNFCNQMADNENWDSKVKELYTSASDIGKISTGLTYDSGNAHWLLDYDPFFADASRASYKALMQADLDSYSTNVLNNTASGFNPLGLTQYVDYMIYRSILEPKTTTSTGAVIISNATPTNWNSTTAPTCRVPDREWSQYKEAYFELKQKYYDMVRAATTCSSLTCDVGQPLTTTLPGTCPTPTAFAVVSDGTAPTSSGMQGVKLTYSGDPYTGTISLKINYPTSVAARVDPAVYATFPQTVSLSYSQFPYAFSLPDDLPLNTVLMSNVSCSNPSPLDGLTGTTLQVTDNNTSDTQSQIYYEWMTEGLFDANGHYVYFTVPNQVRTTTVTLVNSAGTPVVANIPITINVKYHVHFNEVYYDDNWDDHTVYVATTGPLNPGEPNYTPAYAPYDITKPLTISPGQSSITYTYQGLESYNISITYPQYEQDITCYSSVSGINSVTGLSLCPDVPVVSACPIAYQGKQARFTTVSQTTPVLSQPQSDQLKANNNAQLTAQVNDACTTSADALMTALTPGLNAISMAQGDRDNLRSAFVETCNAGGDVSHISGVSDLSGSTATATYSSFGDAIKHFAGISSFTAALNPWLTNDPYPYSSQPQGTSTQLTSTDPTDYPTLCTKLTNYYNDYLAQLGGGTASDDGFYSYLQTRFGTAVTISSADVAMLRQSCSCNNIVDYFVDLPPFLDDKAQVSWTDYQTAKSNMLTAFGGSLSTGDAAYPTILTNYMNQHFGFMFNYDNYIAFENADHTTTPVLYHIPPYSAPVNVDVYAPVEAMLETVLGNGSRAYDQYIADARSAFLVHYIATCAQVQPSATLQSNTNAYHYTLYYYDQADNLVRTVPPDGVHLLSKGDIDRAQLYRTSGGGDDCSANYNGPASNSLVTTALTQLSTALTNTTGGAIELWMFNNTSQPNQLITVTPDNSWLMQVFTSGNRMGIDIYPLSYNSTSPGKIKFLANSIHYTIDITSVQNNPWMHLVLQSGTTMTQANLSVYVNGNPATIISNRAMTGGAWKMASGSSAFTFTQQNLITLKHLRFYTRPLTQGEITNNANSSCFMIPDLSAQTANYTGATQQWYRFNVPTSPGPTTMANSLAETQFSPVYPAHTMTTNYAYNSTNQVIQQNSPDAGNSNFWYDLLSRLNFSQNAQQAIDGNYSYTQYDQWGRISEVGLKTNGTSLSTTGDFYLDKPSVDNFNTATGSVNKEITHTWYDQAAPSITSPTANNIASLPEQDNLRKRVAATTYTDQDGNPVQQATYYNYDLDGNVKTLWQQVNGLGIKRIDYEYDLISGKVNFVRYQDGQPDKFYYQYDYDAENRLTHAWSGTTALTDAQNQSTLLPDNKRLDAYYEYYLHGPLARVELGDQLLGKVQGIDYAYTLQGWLKGVNSTSLTAATDMGGDADTAPTINNNVTIAKDAFGYSLGYYNGDYSPIGGSGYTAFNQTYQPTPTDITGQSLYNGNISNRTVAISTINSGSPVGYTYKYDQLDRIKTARQHDIGISNTTWNATSMTNAFAENFTYDRNGNLLIQQRNDGSGTTIDNLVYNHTYDGNNHLINNKLNGIQNGTSTNTYTYDAIGERKSDSRVGITDIGWNLYGKLASVTGNTNVTYAYNTNGQRVSKTVNSTSNTYYVYDGQGNIMAMYNKASNSAPLIWSEQDIYGSKRLGTWSPRVNLTTGNADDGEQSWQRIGHKNYELDDHRSNILATISDRNVPHYTDPTDASTFNYYEADVLTGSDTYSFGLEQPGRQYANANNTAGYKYGYNGKENDNDLGNSQNYGMREYDKWSSVFWSVDPLTKEYPWYTPYQFAGDKPITFIDRDGEEEGYEFAEYRQRYGVFYDASHNKIIKFTEKQIQEGQQARARGAIIGTALVGVAFAGPEVLPALQRVVAWSITNPQGTMAVTGLVWGAVTDEDMPGGFDDISRDVRNGIKVGEKSFQSVERAVKYESYIEKYGTKVANAIWDAGGKGKGTNKLAKALEHIGISLANKQVHHIIPTELIERNTFVRKAVEEGFDFNGAINGIALGAEKHLGSHPSYTNMIDKLISRVRENNPTQSAKEVLESVANQARGLIEKTDGKINKINQ